MKKLSLFAVLFVAAALSSCSKHDNVEPQQLAIAFAEGNSLDFNVGETKTVHYTITGGSNNTVVKAELQNPDNAYEFYITPTSATEGTIKITAQIPSTDNRVIVTVSDGLRTIMAAIDVTITLKASFDGKTVEVKTPGTLSKLLADYDKTTITELTVIGNLNDKDITTLKNLPNLAVLDMEHVNLKTLPKRAFDKKTSLTFVKLPLALKTIESFAFYGCSSLTSITIGNSVTTIGLSAFSGCSGLTSITIGNSVTTIERHAFYGCSSLTSVTIGNGVTKIGERAFAGCNNLKDVYITDIAKWCAIEFDSDYGNPLFYAKNLYLNGELVTELAIPDSVTTIGALAFSNCTSLTSITIPDSVTTIGDGAFWNCTSLTSVTIHGVTTIGNSAFSNCSSLTSITIPDNVTSIGDYAFYYCDSLTSITIPDNVTSIGDSAFEYCRSLTNVTIPDGVMTIENRAFYQCTSLTSVTIGNSVTTIGERAFYECNNLKDVYITDIAKWFAIKFGDDFANPLHYAHNLYCNGGLVTNLVIPDGVTTIGNYAFRYCDSLTSITIPDSVTKIGDYAFFGCSSLTSVTIGSGVTSIGERAFYYARLTSIYCKAKTPPTIGSLTFLYINTLYVPTGCKETYAAADEWKNAKEIIEMEFE